MKFYKVTSVVLFMVLVVTQPSMADAANKKSKSNKKTQTLNFDGMDVNSAGGTPRSSLTSAAEKPDFDYFFDTDINFEEKIINSLESVR